MGGSGGGVRGGDRYERERDFERFAPLHSSDDSVEECGRHNSEYVVGMGEVRCGAGGSLLRLQVGHRRAEQVGGERSGSRDGRGGPESRCYQHRHAHLVFWFFRLSLSVPSLLGSQGCHPHSQSHPCRQRCLSHCLTSSLILSISSCISSFKQMSNFYII